ncbi:RDD family protein [Pedobacter sp. ASV28]|uniref:RDD family protein n=1 Tax=Pedobacter sp. ASV28 TaxID=2795123 RepID=UPI0018EA7B56
MIQESTYGDNIEYCSASLGKRLANYIIDLIAFYIIIFFAGFIMELAFPGIISAANINGLLDKLLTLCLYGLVMFIIEMVFQGKSLGKLITGTKAVNRNGEIPTINQFLARNFIRAVPFNAFSALGSPCSPWHDNWSDTIVVDEKLLNLQQRKDVFFAELKNKPL